MTDSTLFLNLFLLFKSHLNLKKGGFKKEKAQIKYKESKRKNIREKRRTDSTLFLNLFLLSTWHLNLKKGGFKNEKTQRKYKESR